MEGHPLEPWGSGPPQKRMFPFSFQDMCLFQCDIWSSVKEGRDRWGRRELLTPPHPHPRRLQHPPPPSLILRKHRNTDKEISKT